MNKLFKSQFKSLEIMGALAFLSVIAVQYYIRPAYGNQNDALTFFLGVAPNFFGAIGICIANFVYNKQNFSTGTKMTLSVLSTIGILGIWEAVLSASGKVFDNWDIVFTVIGALIGLAGMLLAVRKNRNSNDLKIQIL